MKLYRFLAAIKLDRHLARFDLKFANLSSAIALLTPFILVFINCDRLQAQIIPDDTLGTEASIVTPNVEIKGLPADRIGGGAIRESNLFHSFEQFNIADLQRVYFANPAGITNIFSRVTGSDLSEIFGTLGVNGNANLFLINPNGIIFGENASLDVGGSFVGSTADAVQFGDNLQFSANASQITPLLTVSIPIGLQFGGNAKSIQVQGNGQGQRFTSELIELTDALRVQPNQTLALVGGNVALEGGTLKTAGGRIELGSVAGSGVVTLTPIDTGFALGYADVQTFGDIQLSGGAVVDASGAGGGDIQVQGRRVTLQDGSQIEASTLGAGGGGMLNVNALESIELIGATPDGQSFSAFLALVYQGATGAGGNLTVKTEQLSFRDGLISTSVEEGAIGNGGNLTVDTEQLIVRDGAQIGAGTLGKGDGGSLIVSARESVELIGDSSGLFTSVNPEVTGDGGNLTVDTEQLIVRDGAQIGAGTLGKGDGGSLIVSARESVELIGDSSGLFTSVGLNATGNGGQLTVETGQLTVRDGATIQASAFGAGEAGNIEINAQDITLDKGRLTAETRVGNQGNISLNNTDTLLLRNNSQITTNATESATGGDITINSEGIAALDNSDITANAVQGQGGNIQITTQGIFSEPDSQITAASELGIDGTVTLNTPDVDPTSGIIELPNVPIDAENILAQDLCKLEDEKIAKGSSFIITGRGGLTPTSADSLGDVDRVVNWVSREDLEVSQNGAVGIRQREVNNSEKDLVNQSYPNLQQSQDLLVATDGSAWLTANAYNTASNHSGIVHPECGTVGANALKD